MSSGPPVFKNHIFTRIKEQVVFENEIGRVRKDYESFLFTLFAQSAFQIEDRKEKIRVIADEVTFDKLTLSDIKKVAFFVSLSESHKIDVNKGIFDKLEVLLESLKESTNYPLSSKSVICWALRNVNRYSHLIDEIRTDLEKKAEQALSKFHYLEGIEISFGTVDDKSISKILENPIQFSKEAEKWPRDKIAKAIIRLSLSSKFDVSELIKLLEEKVDIELSSWIEPDIWLAVVESEKIINSNIPQGEINHVLENLKKVDSSWTKLGVCRTKQV